MRLPFILILLSLISKAINNIPLKSLSIAHTDSISLAFLSGSESNVSDWEITYIQVIGFL